VRVTEPPPYIGILFDNLPLAVLATTVAVSTLRPVASLMENVIEFGAGDPKTTAVSKQMPPNPVGNVKAGKDPSAASATKEISRAFIGLIRESK
jgi:hypothetical protein